MPPTPRDIGVARGFWAQAHEDVQVARILLMVRRYSSALVACQHAAEKAMKAIMTLQLGDGTFKYDHRMIDALSNALPLVFGRLDFACVARIRQLESWLPKRPLAVQGNHTLHTDINSEYPWSPIGGGGAVITPAAYFREKACRRALCAGHRTPPCRLVPYRAYPAPAEAEIIAWHESSTLN
jgi:HEPN domain-containing protein